MTDHAHTFNALKNWVLEQNEGLDSDALTGETALIERRYLTSLQLTELMLLIEELRDAPIDAESLRPGAFRDLNTIVATFFSDQP